MAGYEGARVEEYTLAGNYSVIFILTDKNGKYWNCYKESDPKVTGLIYIDAVDDDGSIYDSTYPYHYRTIGEHDSTGDIQNSVTDGWW